ncbi:MAG: hypothetical protein KDB80_16860 [Planctomycetes bacterium]|nr:hypothetical protein [Planctomycetota bacterium]
MTKVRFRHRLEYAAFRTVIAVANAMPEVVAYGIVAAIGRLFFRLSKRRQGIALRMLRNAFPNRGDADLLRVGRIATGNIFKVGLDMMRLSSIDRERQRDRFDFREFEQKLPPPPFLGVTAHLGSWEVAAVGMAQFAGSADVVVQTFRNPLVQGFLERTRGRAGLTLHPRRGGIRGLARALEKGGVGLQAVDQNQRLRGLVVPFSGELARTGRAAATLAVRKGYPVAVGATVRVGTGFRFKGLIVDVLRVEPSGDRERDVEHLVREINARLEGLVLQYPEQYLWIHDRYRTRPPQPEP